nr:MAG TPA: hypothetical protein [Bacteriophage sp.]
MKDVKGATLEEIRMIRAIQSSVGALDNGYIGNQTMSDIAAKLGADCFPLNVELYGQPCILARDIEPVNMSGPLPKNAISGSFSWQGQPCSILVRGGKVVRGMSCHYPRPESVLYKTTDGAVRIARVSSAAALGDVVWAVGGLGLLDCYAPAAEGFVGAYSDVLRKTNHTVLGYKGGMLYGVYCRSMTAQQINAFVRNKLKLTSAVMLDGGHVAAINGACSKINTQTRQFYAVRFL